MNKWCNHCKKYKNISHFNLRSPKTDSNILQAYCKQCNKIKNNQWYKNNAEKHKKRIRKTDALRRNIIDDFLDEAKNNPCTDCGIKYHPWVMEFDHIKYDKISSIASMKTRKISIKKIKEEMDKCELVCANCHRMRTFNRALKKSKRLQKRYVKY